MDDTKFCPRCKAEYLPRAHVCADCGVELEWSSRAQQYRLAQLPSSLADAGWDGWPEGEILGQVAGDMENVC